MNTTSFKSSFSIPWQAPSLNQLLREHFTKRRDYLETVGLLIVKEIGRPDPRIWKQKMRVIVKIVRPGRRYDSDNGVAASKIILDALRRFCWIYSDSPKWCEWVPLPCELAAKGQPARVDITLETIAE